MFSVTIDKIVKEFDLEVVSQEEELSKREIKTSDINRPGLSLAGYLKYFGNERIQIIGKVETSYLRHLDSETRRKKIDDFFKENFPCIIVARKLEVCKEMLESSEKYKIPILRTKQETSCFLAAVIRYLNLVLAPRTTKHGVLVEIYGQGILILGESGVGKSETAMELVKRGHRLIADDVVEIRRVSDRTLLGTAPDIIRHLVEIRGVGIVDVKNLYGVGAIKMMDNIDLVINMELWDEDKIYDRLGLEEESIEILDITIPSITIPVRPGRNLAIIMEIASMNFRQKTMGYNAAKVLSERVMKGENID